MTHRRLAWFRSRLALLIAILALLPAVQLGSASAQTDPEPDSVDGGYTMNLNATRDCHQASGGTYHRRQRFRVFAKIEQSGSTLVFIAAGGPYEGSIDHDLNFDVPVKALRWIGHFTILSDGGATISGQVVGECSGVTRPFLSIKGTRTSGGPSPLPSSSPTLLPGGEPGLDAADEATLAAIDDLCKGNKGRYPCKDATDYGTEWDDAMIADINALGELPSKDTKYLLLRLRSTLEAAATLGQLHCPGSEKHAFPAVSALLPSFGRYFVQAVTQVAQKKPVDDLEFTVFSADILLRDALRGFSEDYAKGIHTYACRNGGA